MSTTAPSLPIPYVSVPVERFIVHNGPSRAWILRAERELRDGTFPDGLYGYMRLTTGASTLEVRKQVEIIDIQQVENNDDEVRITVKVFGYLWSGRYNMHSREGWVGR
jgi:hypothetical protein